MTRRDTHATVGREGHTARLSPQISAVPPEQLPRPRGARAATFQSEHVLQIAVSQFLDHALPPDAFWTSIDSAGRGPRDGARMKKRGVRKGVPDILVLVGRHTIWFELKSAKGVLSGEQLMFAERAAYAKNIWRVVRSVDQVEKCLLDFGIPLRCRVSA